MDNIQLIKILRDELYDKYIEQEPLAFAIISHLMDTDKETATKILDDFLINLENKIKVAIKNQTTEAIE